MWCESGEVFVADPEFTVDGVLGELPSGSEGSCCGGGQGQVLMGCGCVDAAGVGCVCFGPVVCVALPVFVDAKLVLEICDGVSDFVHDGVEVSFSPVVEA